MKPKRNLVHNFQLAVFCSGFGSNFQAIINAVRSQKIPASIAVMVCDNPKAFAIQRALKNSIPVFVLSPKLFKTRQDYEKVVVGVLRRQKVDLVILAGFMRILTPTFVKAYKNRILNIHPSLLPKFKGAHAIRDAFEAKVKETGVSVHQVTEELDAGPIVLQKKIIVKKNENLTSLEARIHRIEHQIYPQAIRQTIHQLTGSRS